MSKSTFIDFRAVKREVTMVQVLEHYGLMSRMKQNGDSITGACPIHEGKNETAFRVSISKNCWNCFSQCGCGGNVLDFVVKKEKVSLPKAARLLVEWFNLKIESPKNDPPRREKPDSRVRDKNETKRETAKLVEQEDEKGENKPLEFVLKNLQTEHPYLTERGLSPETIQTFGLGLCQKGLLAGRIAIPIRNAKGELVAYAGRWPGDTDREKYLFPKGFKKSLELFNLDQASKEPADKPLIIVEGFFDCIMLHQHGYRNVVALMGSSMSPAQEGLIRKHTDSNSRVVVMLDEDEAGQSAREEIAGRLAKFCFAKVHVFEEPGTQPEHLTADEVQQLFLRTEAIMDVHCTTCGEPWDVYHLRHDAIFETDLDHAEAKAWSGLSPQLRLSQRYREKFKASGYEFGASVINVMRCPACPKDARSDPDKAALKAGIVEILGDDEDGIAATMEDFGL